MPLNCIVESGRVGCCPLSCLQSIIYYVDGIVDKLEDCGLGCWFGDVFVGCMLYVE